ncbi:MAG: hypothetical protein MUC43_04815 [Pirellula sp.]|jgi:cyanophycin synthetase|nr:hypothetical protein [Pirellula sp.]
MMRIAKTHSYTGPNRWSKEPVAEYYIEFDRDTSPAVSELSSIVDDLHRLSGVEAASFPPQRLTDFSFLLPFEYEELDLLTECVRTAMRLVRETPVGQAIDIMTEHRRLVDLADDLRLGPSSRAILRAAKSKGIPYFRLNQGSLVQFGQGIHQRRTWTAETDATSAIAEAIASDKQLTRSLLEAVGVNVPRGRRVASREDAWAAALEVGLPVAVKPRNANHAVGVSLDLSDRDSVMDAFDWACRAGHTTDVLVEQFIKGDHHRILVIGGELVAAARGQREYVCGDGVSSVQQLVEELNRDPRRGENYTDILQVVKLDDAAAIVLRKQGLEFHSIPEAGRQVLVVHVGDLIEDCTDKVHPQTADVAILAAKTVGLDIAGMDVVAEDISKSLTEQRGCIIEVNAGPSLTPHVAPLIGSPRPVGDAVVKLLYPSGTPSTVPIFLLVDAAQHSDYDTNEFAHRLIESLQTKGHFVGMSADREVSVSNQASFVQRPVSEFRSLLLHPKVTTIVLQMTWRQIFETGVPCGGIETIICSEKVSPLSGDPKSNDSPAAASWLGALASIKNAMSDTGVFYRVGNQTPTDFHSVFIDATASSFQNRESFAGLSELIGI